MVQEFNIVIEHKPGKINKFADYLSRYCEFCEPKLQINAIENEEILKWNKNIEQKDFELPIDYFVENKPKVEPISLDQIKREIQKMKNMEKLQKC